MADIPRMIMVKGHCSHCQVPVGVEVPEPEPKIVKVTEPCKCGMDSEARQTKFITTAATFILVSLFLSFMGSCISNHLNTTEQIRMIKEKEKYEIYKANSDLPNEPDYGIRKKVEEKK